MSRQQPTVSIVIPVYNEEAQLAACLDAIACQTVAPYEVIIVDNNSTDHTVAIARQYSFVRIVPERRQGIVHARNRGFDAARGEVIGRLDTDTRLSPQWVARVQHIFQDTSVAAVSGGIGFHDTPFPRFFSQVDGFFRRFLAHNLNRRQELFLYGSNMAIRTSAWKAIQGSLCADHRFHEDIDMAAHLAHSSFKVVFDEQLRVNVSARRIDSRWKSYYPYVMANSRTYAAHRLKSRFFMYPVQALTLIFYVPLRLLYRSYNVHTGRFSARRIFYTSASSERVSPVSDSF